MLNWSPAISSVTGVHIFHRTVFSPFPACCPAPSWTWHCIRSAAYLLLAHGLSTRNWTKHVPSVSILLKYSPRLFSADGSMVFHSKSPGYPWATPPKLPSACRVKSASRASSNEASNRASWSPKQVSSNGQPCDRSWTWQLAAGGWRLESVGMGNGGCAVAGLKWSSSMPVMTLRSYRLQALWVCLSRSPFGHESWKVLAQVFWRTNEKST